MSQPSGPAGADGLCQFIDGSPSPYHVCATVAAALTAAGYTELAERDRWQAGGRYFTVRAASIVAWNSGGRPDRPFRVVGGHTDSPNLRVKQHPDRFLAGWQVVALQPYGGAWLNSWLDRWSDNLTLPRLVKVTIERREGFVPWEVIVPLGRTPM